MLVCTNKVPVLLASSTTIVSVASEVTWTDIHVLRIARPTTRHKKGINPSPRCLPITRYPLHLSSPLNPEIVMLDYYHARELRMVVKHIVLCCHIHLGNDARMQQQLVIKHWPNKIYLWPTKTLTVVGHNEQTLFLRIYLIFFQMAKC